MASRRARAFRTAESLRTWFARHGGSESELTIRLYKTRAKARGVTYREALDEALCHGWIDGVRHALDADSFTQRFSPRRQGSRWSAVNLRRAAELDAEGRMAQAGLAAWKDRDRRAAGYSFESRPQSLPAADEKALHANARAWAFWSGQAPWYRRTATHWVVSAKREETRRKRLAQLIERSAAGRGIGLLEGRTKAVPGVTPERKPASPRPRAPRKATARRPAARSRPR